MAAIYLNALRKTYLLPFAKEFCVWLETYLQCSISLQLCLNIHSLLV